MGSQCRVVDFLLFLEHSKRVHSTPLNDPSGQSLVPIVAPADTVSIFIQRLMAICPGMANAQPYNLVKESIIMKLKQQKFYHILSHICGEMISPNSDASSSSRIKGNTRRVVVKRANDNILGVKLKQNADLSSNTMGKFYVSSVKNDSVAANVLQPDDVVVAINDEDVTKYEFPELIQHLHTLPGDVAFTIVRSSDESRAPNGRVTSSQKVGKSTAARKKAPVSAPSIPTSSSQSSVQSPVSSQSHSSDGQSSQQGTSSLDHPAGILGSASEEDFNVADCSGCGRVGEFKRYFKPGRSYYKPHYIKASLSETGRIKRCGTFTVNPRADYSYPFPRSARSIKKNAIMSMTMNCWRENCTRASRKRATKNMLLIAQFVVKLENIVALSL